MSADQLDYLATLRRETPAEWGGLGALYMPPDPRDYPMSRAPGVPEVVAEGLPASALVEQWRAGPGYNQGPVPSCVMHTLSYLESVNNFKEHGRWFTYNAPQMHRETGPENQGRDPRSCLQYCVDTGCLREGRRDKVGRYFLARRDPAGFLEDVKGAIAAGTPVALSMLLPTDFGRGSAGPLTTGYHEVASIGYDDGRSAFRIKNSWGDGWGEYGAEWVPYTTLTRDGMQGGYCYAYLVTDAVDTDINPPPPPPPPDAVPVLISYGVAVGGTITLRGQNFGAVPFAVVMTPGITATIRSWMPTEVVAVVPAGAKPGPVVLIRPDGHRAVGGYLAVA